MARTGGAAPASEGAPARHEALALTGRDVVDLYRRMVLARTLDERIWTLNRQGKVPIAASSQGHEAAELGSLLAAVKDGDCFLFPYYRCLALKVSAGLTPLQAMLSFMGKEGDPYSGGRQFPLQGANIPNGVIQLSNVVGAGLTQSVGYALACRLRGEDTVVFSYFGDGASSQGECHEAMNFAGVHRLPVVFICENNRYAISVPLGLQMAVDNVADRAASYGFSGRIVNGMDPFDVYESTLDAISHARSNGPMLLEMKVERYMPHTTDDDDRRYRSPEEVEEGRRRDPIDSLQSYLLEAELLTPEQDSEIRDHARRQVNAATDDAEAAPFPHPSTVYDHVYRG